MEGRRKRLWSKILGKMGKDEDGLLLGNPHINLRKDVDRREAGRMKIRNMKKKKNKEKTMKKMEDTWGKNKDQPFTYFFLVIHHGDEIPRVPSRTAGSHSPII